MAGTTKPTNGGNDNAGNETVTSNAGNSRGGTENGKPAAGGDATLNRNGGSDGTTIKTTPSPHAAKKRGRPKKDVESAKETTQTVTAKPRTRRTNTKASRKKEALETTQLLLGMAEAAAIMAGGPDAQMNAFERPIIETSLSRLIENTSDSAIERAVSISTPLMLVVGLGMWGLRVSSLAQQNQTGERLPVENDDIPLPDFQSFDEMLANAKIPVADFHEGADF
jgi:hypothetical protein